MNYLDEYHGVNQLAVNGTRQAPRRVYMFGDSPDSGMTLFWITKLTKISAVLMTMDGTLFLFEPGISRERATVHFILQSGSLMTLARR